MKSWDTFTSYKNINGGSALKFQTRTELNQFFGSENVHIVYRIVSSEGRLLKCIYALIEDNGGIQISQLLHPKTLSNGGFDDDVTTYLDNDC